MECFLYIFDRVTQKPLHANAFTFVYCDTLMNVILFVNFSLNLFSTPQD